MATASRVSDDLLDPITAEQPAGVDLRWTSEWDRIKEARRADDGLDSGKWAKKDQKTSDWPRVRDLVTMALRERSKDLQLALWLTESEIKIRGFEGLRDGLRLTRELIVRYWDRGLYPVMEDGPEDRAGPFEWLNNKLVDSIAALSITPRDDKGREYSFIDLQEARRIGSNASGRITMEAFEDALSASKRAAQEELSGVFREVCDEFNALEKVIDEKFGEAAPNISDCRTALSELSQALSDILEKKREAEPDVSSQRGPAVKLETAARSGREESEQNGQEGANMVLRLPLSLMNAQTSQPAGGGSWQEAEMLIRSGQVEKGLAAMMLLAANETSGRSRFQRRFLLAEVCLASRRERLARSILEELAEQIDKFQLDLWESSELIGGVWTTLHKLYKRSADGSDADRAVKLYERICRLDPWQAVGCDES
jgi:type VI secretion system protein ImpA